jgi:hypothetical protein
MIVFLALAGFASSAYAQDEVRDADVPEWVRKELVHRILIYKFKPSSKRRSVPISSTGIKQEWLPKIGNTEFNLIDLGDDAFFEDIYFFREPQTEGEAYSIAFAFGDPECSYIGDAWRFRFSNGKVRMWYEAQIGVICTGHRSLGPPPRELNSYPNEIQGFEFFDRGKLAGLRLAESTKEDVKARFGEDCGRRCEFDENWEVFFDFLGSSSYTTTEVGKKLRYIAKAEYLDKLDSITLRPKGTILFDQVKFSSVFAKSNGYRAAHDGRGGGTNTSYWEYVDRFGLRYKVLEAITLTTIKDLKWQKGELMTIEYTMPKAFRKTMFDEVIE